jgi:FKBP-type peptidyl-prolyl cis-trans isomerase
MAAGALIALLLITFLKPRATKPEPEPKQIEQTENQEEQPMKTELQQITEKFPDAIATESGLHYIVLTAGGEGKPNEGDTVVVHYTGKLMDDSVFDSSVTRGDPFSFPLMAGRVIKGWDIGLSDMTKGEKRLLIIPSELGYGERGHPPVIPPASTLVFEVELLDIK